MNETMYLKILAIYMLVNVYTRNKMKTIVNNCFLWEKMLSFF